MPGVSKKAGPCAHPGWALALLCLAPLPATSLAAETVQSLRYGASLYHYYQRDYFAAITELSAAQQLDELGPHTAGAELLRGGMALSYGMDRQAESIFKAQLQEDHASVNADQVWFYLGKLAWQRGDAPRARQSLAKLSADYAGELVNESQYLKASTALALGDGTSAEAGLAALPEDSRWRDHLNYNLGATAAAAGEWYVATDYFDKVAGHLPLTDEDYALYDKSLTAAGYAYLADGEFDLSARSFQQVRLQGPYSNRALLGYGWSAAEQGDYQAALSPWQQLAGRSVLDESARESLLAVPYAYEQLGHDGIALARYRDASEQYQQALDGLDTAIEAFRDDPLGPLLGIADEHNADWLFENDILPQGEHATYLQHLVTRHSYQVGLRELRDLYGIASHLERAQERLQVLKQVDSHQQAVWSSLVQQNRRQDLAQQQLALAQQQQSLIRQLKAAIAEQGGRLLADKQQTQRWARLERAAASANAINATAEHTQRVRVLRGLLTWEDSERYPAQAWQARKHLQELETLAQGTAEAIARVDEAIGSREQSNFAPDIASLTGRTQVQSDVVEQTIVRSESHLRSVAIAELERQGEQIRRALGQSQLAIAHIQDRAMQVSHYE